jgi:hypothetical protein
MNLAVVTSIDDSKAKLFNSPDNGYCPNSDSSTQGNTTESKLSTKQNKSKVTKKVKFQTELVDIVYIEAHKNNPFNSLNLDLLYSTRMSCCDDSDLKCNII